MRMYFGLAGSSESYRIGKKTILVPKGKITSHYLLCPKTDDRWGGGDYPIQHGGSIIHRRRVPQSAGERKAFVHEQNYY